MIRPVNALVHLPAASLPAEPAADRAAALEARARLLERRVLEESGRYVRELDYQSGGAAAFLGWAGGTPEGRAAEAQTRAVAAPLVAAHARDSRPMIEQLTAMARALDRYRRTGELPEVDVVPLPPDDAPPSEPEVAALSLDLRALMRQLRVRERPAPARDAPALVARRRPAPTAPARPDPVAALIEQLLSPDPRRRALAADQLGQRGADAARAVPVLRGALHDSDRRVRASAALALGDIGRVPLDAIVDLRRMLADPDPDVRFSSQTALARLSAPPGEQP